MPLSQRKGCVNTFKIRLQAHITCFLIVCVVKQKRTRRRHQGRKLELKEVVVDNKYPEPSSRPQKTSCDVRAPRSTERKAPVDKSSLLDRGCVAGGEWHCSVENI